MTIKANIRGLIKCWSYRYMGVYRGMSWSRSWATSDRFSSFWGRRGHMLRSENWSDWRAKWFSQCWKGSEASENGWDGCRCWSKNI